MMRSHAVSGHTDRMNIDHAKLFSKHHQFDPRSRPNACGGPDNLFYYSSVNGVMQIRADQRIMPDHARFAPKSKRYIYCPPVDVLNLDCPPACSHVVR